jgi:hypothetical protein
MAGAKLDEVFAADRRLDRDWDAGGCPGAIILAAEPRVDLWRDQSIGHGGQLRSVQANTDQVPKKLRNFSQIVRG